MAVTVVVVAALITGIAVAIVVVPSRAAATALASGRCHNAIPLEQRSSSIGY